MGCTASRQSKSPITRVFQPLRSVPSLSSVLGPSSGEVGEQGVPLTGSTPSYGVLRGGSEFKLLALPDYVDEAFEPDSGANTIGGLDVLSARLWFIYTRLSLHDVFDGRQVTLDRNIPQSGELQAPTDVS